MSAKTEASALSAWMHPDKPGQTGDGKPETGDGGGQIRDGGRVSEIRTHVTGFRTLPEFFIFFV